MRETRARLLRTLHIGFGSAADLCSLQGLFIGTEMAHAHALCIRGHHFVVRIDWAQALRGTFIPSLSFKREQMSALVAVLGTTNQPLFVFFGSRQRR